jgi:putative transposase
LVIRGYKYRLAPTPEQASKLTGFMGVCRLIYNAALLQRETQWRQHLANTGKHISIFTQSRELTDLREQFDWIRAVSRTMQAQALRDLDMAFQRYFRGESAYPKPRRKFENDSVRILTSDGLRLVRLNAKWSAITVPKVGLVKFRDTRARIGVMKSITITCRAGRWFISFMCTIETPVPQRSELPSVGIDRGIANTIALSTGEMMSVPESLVKLERRQRRARHVLSRRQRGSKRHAKQRRRLSRLCARGADIRRDWHHRVTTDIAKRFGYVAIEALKVSKMTAAGRTAQKRGLNRSILNQGWGLFTELLTYKLEERGGQLAAVDPAYTSQTCSSCGTIDKESRESQAVFHCRHCGFEAHADHNAATNILRRSTPVTLVEGAGYGPGEARTINHVADLAA